MELNSCLFPAPKSSYSLATTEWTKSDLIFFPRAFKVVQDAPPKKQPVAEHVKAELEQEGKWKPGDEDEYQLARSASRTSRLGLKQKTYHSFVEKDEEESLEETYRVFEDEEEVKDSYRHHYNSTA